MKNPVNYRDDLKKVKGLKTIRGEDADQDDKDELRIVPDPNSTEPYFDDESQQYETENSDRTYSAAEERYYDRELDDIPEGGHTPYILGFRLARTKKWK